MAARAYWQGQLRLALVSIPVEIYSATKSGAKISFRQIHEPTGKPVSYEKIVQGEGPVDRDEILKGYEISKGNYVLLEQDEIEHVKLESRKTLELVQFVEAHEIDPLYFDKPYYVAPADDLAEEAYVVLRDALRQAKKVALGQLAVRGREYLVAIKPCGKGLLLETLRYADEVREGQGFFKAIGGLVVCEVTESRGCKLGHARFRGDYLPGTFAELLDLPNQETLFILCQRQESA